MNVDRRHTSWHRPGLISAGVTECLIRSYTRIEIFDHYATVAADRTCDDVVSGAAHSNTRRTRRRGSRIRIAHREVAIRQRHQERRDKCNRDDLAQHTTAQYLSHSSV
jgi:hypothetical protein